MQAWESRSRNNDDHMKQTLQVKDDSCIGQMTAGFTSMTNRDWILFNHLFLGLPLDLLPFGSA